MKDYSKMSDFQININVAKSIGVNAQEWNGMVFGGIERDIDNVVSAIGVIDYCNNPSDAWPIIVDNKIWTQPDMVGDGLWHCMDCNDDIHAKDKNPLRAAMIVYLMMKDEEK